MPIAMEKKRFITLLLRGMLGGALSGLLLVAGLHLNQFHTWPLKGPWFFWLLIAYAFFGLPAGVVIGGLAGTTIGLIHHYAGAHLNWLSRIVIGMLIGMGCWQAIVWVQKLWVENASDYPEGSWHESLIGLLLVGGSIGGLSGLIVGRQRVRQEQDDVKTN